VAEEPAEVVARLLSPEIIPPPEPPPAKAGATAKGARIVAAKRNLRISSLLFPCAVAHMAAAERTLRRIGFH
jgi:hypothetical protein